MRKWKIPEKTLPSSYIQFKNAMNNDLNAPKALAVFFWMKKKLSDIKNNVSTEKELGEAWRFLIVFNEIF